LATHRPYLSTLAHSFRQNRAAPLPIGPEYRSQASSWKQRPALSHPGFVLLGLQLQRSDPELPPNSPPARLCDSSFRLTLQRIQHSNDMRNWKPNHAMKTAFDLFHKKPTEPLNSIGSGLI